jgi:hypothetical protein
MTNEQISDIASEQLDDTLRDALDHTGVLGNRNEQVRAHYLAGWASPADQRFGPNATATT